jgi:ketosteroid isomerase-like protein
MMYVITQHMAPENELTAFAALWDNAIVSNNADGIGSFLSDDWIIVGADGITAKSSFLHWIATKVITHHTMDTDQQEVRIYGDMGILISRGTIAGTYYEENFNLYEWSTNVFKKTGAMALCVDNAHTSKKKSFPDQALAPAKCISSLLLKLMCCCKNKQH